MTVSFIPSTATFTISTHTLTWSVTARHRLHRCRHIHFNSHAHVERDFIKKLSDEITKISTHTLTWSVTQHKSSLWCVCIISTHTLTWSVTQLAVANVKWFKHFNSHAHVERDLPLYLSIGMTAKISTHTLTWSVTLPPYFFI